MEIIHVPAPPKEAFNKDRRMSDLIKAQVGHLKHVEEKLPQEIREALPRHQIVTEGEAAQYIAAMTSILRSGSNISRAPAKRVSEIRRTLPLRPQEAISLAAAEDMPVPAVKKGVASNARASRPRPEHREASSKRKK